MGDYDQYSEHFPVGMKVKVGIPVPGGSVFHDWAVIHDIDEDLVDLQLSRDMLPEGVRLQVGTILDIRGGKEDNAYSCRGIIVSEGQRRKVLLRLIGEIVSDELRQYYRIDAFLPIKYFIPETNSEFAAKQQWQAKRAARAELERERRLRQEQAWQRLMRAPEKEEPPTEEVTPATPTDDEPDETVTNDTEDIDTSWQHVIPLAANISGGGLRIVLHHQFKVDDLIMLEIFVPTEPQPRIVDAVGRVVFCNQNMAASKQLQRDSYNTNIEFLYIDERDRDTIVSYIANVQLKRIRQLREHYLGRGLNTEQPEPSDTDRLRQTVAQIMISLIVLAILVKLILYFASYVENRPKGEIERIFEQGFIEYLKKLGRNPPTSP